MSTRHPISWVVASVVFVTTGACASAPADQPASAAPQASASEASASEAPASEAPQVEVDLAPTGLAATISAPEQASVQVHERHLEISDGAGYRLLVGLGAVDPLEEKARIVRDYGVSFKQFVADEGDTVIYETALAGENRFHFFATHRAKEVAWHCRTPEDGIASVHDVRAMIEVCGDVRLREDIDPTKLRPEAPAGG